MTLSRKRPLPAHTWPQGIDAGPPQTMRYARFHPGYGDVAPHFEAMGERLGLGPPGDTAGDTDDSAAEEEEGADRG